jgi:SAM-dependent methyltransferase
MVESTRAYVPAAGTHGSLPLYDPLAWLLGAGHIREALVAQAELRPGLRALDLGCGTGTLLGLLQRTAPELVLTGFDPDPVALDRARRKLGGGVQLDRGFSDALPYPDASFDRVFSSFVFHHLSSDEKLATAREIRRVLRPGGSLHLVDVGGQIGASGLGWLARRIYRHHRLGSQLEDGLLSLLREGGLHAHEVRTDHRWYGPVTWYRAVAPGRQD